MEPPVKSPTFSRPSDLSADWRIETLAKMLARRDAVPYDEHERFAREHFMPLHDEYYLRHIARHRERVAELAVAPHYIHVAIAHPRAEGESLWPFMEERYVIGVDYDANALWIAHIGSIPRRRETGHVAIRHIGDQDFRDVLGYDHDVTGSEYTVALPEGAPPDHVVSYRVQGDLVIDVRPMTGDWLREVARREVERYVQYLAADRIAAVLVDRGLSVTVRHEVDSYADRYVVRVPCETPEGERETCASKMSAARALKLLSEYFTVTSVRVDVGIDADVSDGAISARVSIYSRGGGIDITLYGARSESVAKALLDDIVAQFNALEPRAVTRRAGGHIIELSRAIPVSLAYEPSVRPAALDPVTLYIAERGAYVVDRDCVMTVRHREHGERQVKFAGRYVVHVRHTRVSDSDAAYRNAIVLSRVPVPPELRREIETELAPEKLPEKLIESYLRGLSDGINRAQILWSVLSRILLGGHVSTARLRRLMDVLRALSEGDEERA